MYLKIPLLLLSAPIDTYSLTIMKKIKKNNNHKKPGCLQGILRPRQSSSSLPVGGSKYNNTMK